MKILVCSDIHGSKNAAELISNLDNEQKFDKIFLIGDLLYNGPRNYVTEDYDPNSVFKILNTLKDKIVAVRGNCDADVDLMVLEFSLPIMKIVKVNDKTYYLTHGHEEIFMNEPKENEIYIKGHTHLPLMYKSSNGGIILNPGSMTFPKGKLDKSFIIIDDNDIKLYEYKYNNSSSNNIDILNIYSYNNNNFLK